MPKLQFLMPGCPIFDCSPEIETVKMRLFDDVEQSPSSTSTFTEEWDNILTPSGKGDNSSIRTEDLGINFDPVTPIQRRGIRRARSFDVKRSLFSEKRPASDLDDDEPSPVAKRLRLDPSCFTESSLSTSPVRGSNIIQAVDRLTSEEDLVADGSRDYSLPTVPGKHRDLKSISLDTVADVVSDCYDDKLKKVTIIDCRYPYEFEGGHIKGAVNLYTKDSLQTFLHDNMTSSKQHVLIFHCEFSSERGPRMYRFLRSLDRDLNKDHYPRLHFPEIYLLEGGYKAFFQKHQSLCDPVSYKPMLHEQHTADLRHFRVKSRSWAAGDKSKRSHRCRSRLVL